MILGQAPSSKQNFMAKSNVRAELEKFYEKPIAKVSLELLLTLVTVLFFALFALRPTLSTMAELTREIEDKRTVDAALTSKLAALATAQEEYFTHGDRFEVLEEAIHEQPTLETALFYLEYLVRREDISLASLRIETFPVGQLIIDPSNDASGTAPEDTEVPPSEITVYAIQTSFEGDYANILKFFRAIESVRPLFSVQTFSFTVATNQERETVLQTSAQIYMYGYEQAPRARPNPTSFQPAPASNPTRDFFTTLSRRLTQHSLPVIPQAKESRG